MGCLCSKNKSNSSNGSTTGLEFRPTSTSNPINNQSNSAKSKGNLMSVNKRNKTEKRSIANVIEKNVYKKGFSILMPPTESELCEVKGWLRKRGHLVRNWKKRYFVLYHNSLKYYQEECSESPYGKHLCGQISLRGAVMQVVKDFKPDQTLIIIIGMKGEKDLTIEIDHSIDNKWICALEWTIRRLSKIYIDRILRSSVYFEQSDSVELKSNKDVEVDDSILCNAWLENEQNKFLKAVYNIFSVTRNTFVELTQANGNTYLETAYVCLWSNELSDLSIVSGILHRMTVSRAMSSSGASHSFVAPRVSQYASAGMNNHEKNTQNVNSLNDTSLPTINTSSRSFGISLTISDNAAAKSNKSGKNDVFMDRQPSIVYDGNTRIFIVQFADIASIIEYNVAEYIPINCTSNDSTIYTSRVCKDPSCKKHRNKMFSIETTSGNTFDILCCCQYDHSQLIHSMREIVLYIKLKIPQESDTRMTHPMLNPRMKSLSCIVAKTKLDEVK